MTRDNFCLALIPVVAGSLILFVLTTYLTTGAI